MCVIILYYSPYCFLDLFIKFTHFTRALEYILFLSFRYAISNDINVIMFNV